MIDEDRSGLIDAEELQGAAVALGIPMEENIAVLLGTEKIPFDEFFKRMTAKLSLRGQGRRHYEYLRVVRQRLHRHCLLGEPA